MDQNASGEDSDNIDWDTEDELEIQNSFVPSSSRLTNPDGEASVGDGEAISGTDLSHSKLIPHFVRMGFPEELVAKAIEENGEGNSESILETLLTYSALENSDLQAIENSDLQAIENSDLHALENSPQQEQPVDSDHCSSDYYENFMDDLSDSDSWCEDEESTESLSGKGKALSFLKNMGYTMEEASIAMERCGPDASVDELTDFICAAQMARAADPFFPELPEKPKRKLLENGTWKRKKHRGYDNRTMFDDGETLRLPNPMIGYGVPTEVCPTPHRILPEAAMGPPYFYYENVALAPKGVWDTIKRFLYDVEPEFVDSKYFCAAARKRGYVHNLPINNRFPLLPLPPRTIKEALPLTRRWWPAWDTRTKLNCLQTCIGSAKLTERLRKALEDSIDDEPPQHVQKYVMDECRKWNLVWVGRNKLAPLECDEVEMLLGFPRNHTRGGGISRTDRYKSLGNSFQVDTVAYHLSVLKDMFPRGINMLSLFSGIGGAEVALHKLGVPLNNVVSVEKSEVNRNIVRGWWEQTNQKGKLIDFEDVTRLDGDRLEHIMNNIGGFDLVIGGSPCNNLAGSNRHHRDGLEGKESSLFYDYFRILDLVKCIMAKPL